MRFYATLFFAHISPCPDEHHVILSGKCVLHNFFHCAADQPVNLSGKKVAREYLVQMPQVNSPDKKLPENIAPADPGAKSLTLF